MLTTTTTHLQSPFPACNNNCGSWYFILEGRKEGSIGIGYKRNENYCLKPSKLLQID